MVKLQYFEYTPNRDQELDYHAAIACRFVALTRNGNEFRKTALNEFNADWVWRDLQRLAMNIVDVIDVELGLTTPVEVFTEMTMCWKGKTDTRLVLGITFAASRVLLGCADIELRAPNKTL